MTTRVDCTRLARAADMNSRRRDAAENRSFQVERCTRITTWNYGRCWARWSTVAL